MLYSGVFRLLHTYFIHCDLIHNMDVAPQNHEGHVWDVSWPEEFVTLRVLYLWR